MRPSKDEFCRSGVATAATVVATTTTAAAATTTTVRSAAKASPFFCEEFSWSKSLGHYVGDFNALLFKQRREILKKNLVAPCQTKPLHKLLHKKPSFTYKAHHFAS